MDWKTQAEQKTQYKAIDLSSLSKLDEYSTPDDSLAYAVLNAYLKSAPAHAAGIQENYKIRNLNGIKQQAHSLKSSSANIGAFAISKMSEEIESLAHNNQVEKLKSCVENLEHSFSLLINELAVLKKEMELCNPSQKKDS